MLVSPMGCTTRRVRMMVVCLCACLVLAVPPVVREADVNADVVLRLLRSQATLAYVQTKPPGTEFPTESVDAALGEMLRHEAYVQNFVRVALRKAMRLSRGKDPKKFGAGAKGGASSTGTSAEFDSDLDEGGSGSDGDGGGEHGDDSVRELASLRQLSRAAEVEPSGAMAADEQLSGSRPQSTAELLKLENIRKKDSPDDLAGILEQIEVQRKQNAVIRRRFREGKPQVLLVGREPLGGRSSSSNRTRSWEVACAEGLYEGNWYPRIPGCTPSFRDVGSTAETGVGAGTNAVENDGANRSLRCRRIVRDGVAVAEEARTVAMATERAMLGLFHQGGSTSLVPDGHAASRLGKVGYALTSELRERVRREISAAFGLRTTLYDSGALLTRLKADFDDDMFEVNHTHVYWNAHVDKANIASYDYSALLYLNSQGDGFMGGDFAFIDDDDDKTVAPIAGRLLMFTSGLENLHQVREVTKGTRYVLAMWFTCSSAHQYREQAD